MSDITKTQQGLARKAHTNRDHQFEDLYHLICKREWIEEALQHVLNNDGAETAGVDGMSWKAFNDADKSDFENEKFRQQFIDELQTELKTRRYRPKPVRRVEIPKPGTNKKRPLGIPIWAVHYHSFQAMLGIPCVLLLVERELRSTVIVLLYHTLRCMTSASLLPLSSDGLAQRGDDLRGERNPAWSQRGGTNTLQNASLAPIRNSRDIDIEQLRGSACRVAPISPLSSWCSLRTLWTSSRDVIGIADPLDFADRKRASHASLLSFLIEDGCNLGIGVPRRQRSHTLYHLWAGLAFFPRHLVAWNGQMCESLGLPPNSHIDDIASFRERDIFDQPAHELLALHKGGCRSIPKSRQIMGQAADLLPLPGCEPPIDCPGRPLCSGDEPGPLRTALAQSAVAIGDRLVWHGLPPAPEPRGPLPGGQARWPPESRRPPPDQSDLRAWFGRFAQPVAHGAGDIHTSTGNHCADSEYPYVGHRSHTRRSLARAMVPLEPLPGAPLHARCDCHPVAADCAEIGPR